MKYPLKVNKRQYFYMLLRILKSFKPYNQLCNREAQLFAELLYYNNKYKNIPYEARMKLIFNQDTRNEMVHSLDMSKAALYNNFQDLRKKGFITLNSIDKKYLFDPDVDSHQELTFKFEISEENS